MKNIEKKRQKRKKKIEIIATLNIFAHFFEFLATFAVICMFTATCCGNILKKATF